jgi:polysaccharide biosynthesis transport protein
MRNYTQPMELRYFLSVLSKRKWLLLAAMILSAGATWLIMNNQPKKYKSSAIVQTGITSFKSILVDQGDPFVQEFQIEGKFSNFIEYLKSRTSINPLTKKLMLHDLKPETNETPFRKLQIDKLGITQEQINNYIAALETRNDTASMTDVALQNIATARALEKAIGYDYETLFSKLDIKRQAKTDYVKVEYESEDPKLSYYVVDNFVKEALAFYNTRNTQKDGKSSDFYHQLVDGKKQVLDSLMQTRATYSKANNLVALEKESENIVGQIKDLESVRNEEEKKLAGYKETFNVYAAQKGKISEFISTDYANDIARNNEIKSLTEQREKLLNQWADSKGKDDFIKKQMDDIDAKRNAISYKTAVSRRDQNDPVNQKQNELYMKYVDAQSNKEASEKAVASLNARISQLYGRKSKLVENNADMKRFDQEMDVSQKGYEAAVSGQYQADVKKQSSEAEQQMRVIETAYPPTKPENSKASAFAAFAGLGTLTMATVFLFLLAYMDRSLSSPFQFTKLVNLPMIGVVNQLNKQKVSNLDALYVPNEKEGKESAFFKESLRRVRHEIESCGSKTFLFVSLKEQEGKSFLVASLAYSLSMKNKKILIIDTNFKNNTLSGLSEKPLETGHSDTAVQAFQQKTTRLSIDINLPTVSVIGNKGGYNSPSELLAGVDFRRKIYDLGKSYDYIFLEAACLNKYSDARELVDYAEKVIPVFDASTTLSQADEEGINFFRNLGNNLLGCVLNKADLKAMA